MIVKPFWKAWSIPSKWKECVTYAQQIRFLAKWIGQVDEKVDHIEAGGATVEAGSTTTLPAGQNAEVVNVGSDTAAIFNFKIPRGERGEDGQDGVDGTDGVTPHFNIGTVETLDTGEEATASITGTDDEPVLNLGLPRGLTGQNGADGTNGINGTDGTDGTDGVGITSVEFKETDSSGNNVYTITLTNGNTYDIVCPKGAQGQAGQNGTDGTNGINGINGINGTDGVGITSILYKETDSSGNYVYTVTLTNSNTYDIVCPRGAAGSNGTDGTDGTSGTNGVGISSISFKEVDASGGNVYTILLTNGSTYDFTAPKGTNGTDGTNGTNGTNGTDGTNGVGISSVSFKEVDANGGNVYTISLTNNTTYDFTAPKGNPGSDANVISNIFANVTDSDVSEDGHIVEVDLTIPRNNGVMYNAFKRLTGTVNINFPRPDGHVGGSSTFDIDVPLVYTGSLKVWGRTYVIDYLVASPVISLARNTVTVELSNDGDNYYKLHLKVEVAGWTNLAASDGAEYKNTNYFSTTQATYLGFMTGMLTSI